MTWKRLVQLALAVSVLGVLALSAGADWYGSPMLGTGHGSTVTHGRS